MLNIWIHARYLFFDTEGAHGNILWIFDGQILFVGSTFNHDERDHDFVCNILQHAIAHNTLYGFGLADSNDLQTLARWGVQATRSTIQDLQQDHLSLAASTQQGCKHKVKGIYPHKGVFYAPYTAVFNPDMLWNLVGRLDWATYIMAEAAAYSLIHARQSLLGAGEIIIAWPVKKKENCNMRTQITQDGSGQALQRGHNKSALTSATLTRKVFTATLTVQNNPHSGVSSHLQHKHGSCSRTSLMQPRPGRRSFFKAGMEKRPRQR